MKLSEGVEWGLHCTALLAMLPPGSALNGAALAAYHGVSESYLLKHLKALAKAGILESLPGPKGGYRLARRPGEVTLLDVVEAIEGKEPAFRCTEIRQRGPAAVEPEVYRHPCPINAAMLKAEREWKRALREQTVADLASSLIAVANDRSVRKATIWLEDKVRT